MKAKARRFYVAPDPTPTSAAEEKRGEMEMREELRMEEAWRKLREPLPAFLADALEPADEEAWEEALRAVFCLGWYARAKDFDPEARRLGGKRRQETRTESPRAVEYEAEMKRLHEVSLRILRERPKRGVLRAAEDAMKQVKGERPPSENWPPNRKALADRFRRRAGSKKAAR